MTHAQRSSTAELDNADRPSFEAAFQAAQKSLADGGIHTGAALARASVLRGDSVW